MQDHEQRKLQNAPDNSATQKFQSRSITCSGFPSAPNISASEKPLSVASTVAPGTDSLHQYDELLNAVPEAFIIIDGNDQIVFINAQAEQLFGYNRKDLQGHDVATLIAPCDRSSYRARLASSKSSLQDTDGHPPVENFNFRGERKGGEQVWLNIRFGVLGSTQQPLRIAVLQDITQFRQHEQRIEAQGQELREANAQLEELATRDELTSLNNYRAFRQKLAEEVLRATRYHIPLSVLMLDIDHFKMFNDEFGHPAGDKVLQIVARILRDTARTTDFVARYGGEEFVILLPYTGQIGATVLAERFRKAVADYNWTQRPVTLSVGAATLDTDSDGGTPLSFEDRSVATAFLASADAALYHSKHHGRDRTTHAGDLPKSKERPKSTRGSASTDGSRQAAVLEPLRSLLRRPLHWWHPVYQFRSWLSRAIREENITLFLLGVRWLSLLPPLLAFWLAPASNAATPLIFALALTATLVLSAYHTQITQMVLRQPMYLLIDMALAACFIGFTDGMASPYERYARVPLLAAAFLFQIRGGLMAAVAFTPLYVGALLFARQWSDSPIEMQDSVTEIISFFWFALIFGYPALLLQRLRTATSQLHHAQQEAAHAETLAGIGKMAAQVSHEIRNPLSTIGGFARSVLNRPGDEKRVRKSAAIIAEEVARLEQLLTDMLDMARPPALRHNPENIHDILDKAWLLSNGALNEKSQIVIRKDYAPGLPLAEVDASALLRAFLNVTRNAIQMMPDGGNITFTTQRCGNDEIEVIIADDGPGIAPEVLPTIFAPFVSHRPNGTGLGLAATQRIIEEHGGHIKVHSEPGQGTRLIFCLPIHASTAIKHT